MALLAVGAWWVVRGPLIQKPVANAPERASPPQLATQATGIPGARAAPPAGVQVANHNADDPRCVVKEPPPPTVGDAGKEGEPSQAIAQAAIPPDAARGRILARMKSSANPYANAVAVWLDVHDDDDAPRLAERLRQLAAMATSTRDPRLYSLALRTCWRRTDHECVSLSARRWAELDPGNAMPWLMMLDEAAQHQDMSGMQEAMFHITQSDRLAERQMAPLQPIVDAASGDAESLVAARALAIDAIGITAAQVGPISYTACKRVGSADANVWQQCTAMAGLLEHRSDSLQARLTGALIDQHVSGSSKAREQVAAQMNRMLTMDLAASSGCDDLRAKLAVMRRMAVEGEVSAARSLTP